MKISKETLEVLKNFANINPSILLKPGSNLRTVSPRKNVLGVAKITEKLPVECAIFDLNQLLGVISLFEDPDFEFEPTKMVIKDASGAYAVFHYASKDAIISAPEKNIELPTKEVDVSLESSRFRGALKAASTMGLPHICIVGNNGNVSISAADSSNASANKWSAPIGSTEATDFSAIYRMDQMNFLPRDYKLTISKKANGIAHFSASDVEYFIAAETDSKF